jgi:20S proteasome alpha/beta subunit
VVMASDQMLTLSGSTGDLPQFSKSMRVHPRWYAGYAGDVDQVPQVLCRVTNLLGKYKAPRIERVTDIFLKVYRDHQKRILAQGAKEFDLDFLVVGFDPNGSPRVLAITPPGVEHRYDLPGFWAIGSGAGVALDNLMLRKYRTHQSLDDSIYQIAESKFVAETLLGVGPKTAMAVMFSDASIALLTAEKSDAIRQMWEDEGRPKMPANLGKRIPPLLKFYKGLPVLTIKNTRKRKALKR